MLGVSAEADGPQLGRHPVDVGAGIPERPDCPDPLDDVLAVRRMQADGGESWPKDQDWGSFASGARDRPLPIQEAGREMARILALLTREVLR